MDDILISADVDEVMSRQALNRLKWCETSSDLLTGALWMPLGNLQWALKTGYPVYDKPHTLAFPLIYKWKDIVNGTYKGTRNTKKGTADYPEKPVMKYIKGGIHMTNIAFMPLAILKELSATEDDYYGGYINSA